MADPISILGTAGAVANIIDVLGKIIITFAELRSQWQEADLAVLALESELAALNAALTRIKEWAESCSDDPHHQLTMDLDRCVVCCRLLIGRIDAELSQFQTTAENRLDVASKFRLLLKTKDFEHIQHMIGKQTAAMTLLLTACNTAMLSKQKGLLEDSQTRRVFKTMQDDTASLLVHRDVDSLLTGTATSITSSKRSVIFEFDSTLFISRIYQRWIRGSVKKALLDQQTDKSAVPSSSKKFQFYNTVNERQVFEQRSQKINQGIRRDAWLLQLEIKVLVLGDRSRADIICSMKLLAPERGFDRLGYPLIWTADRGQKCKPAVLHFVFKCGKALADAMRKHQVAPENDDIWEHISYIESAEVEATPAYPAERLDPGFIDALTNIMNSPYFSIDRCHEFDLPMSTEHFLVQLATIASPDYCPSEEDALRAENPTNGAIIEARVPIYNDVALRLFDFNSYRRMGEMKRWIHFCEHADAILFVIDLETYDHVKPGESNHMLETLLFFESLVNSRSFLKSSVILIFDKVDSFKEKLERSPNSFRSHFPDFVDGFEGNNVKAACDFLLARCNALNRARLALYPLFVPFGDYAVPRKILGSIHEMILGQVLNRFLNRLNTNGHRTGKRSVGL
ncbi:GNA-3 g protein alpha subunit GNA-3 [Rhypophila sp. PSN 637]